MRRAGENDEAEGPESPHHIVAGGNCGLSDRGLQSNTKIERGSTAVRASPKTEEFSMNAMTFKGSGEIPLSSCPENLIISVFQLSTESEKNTFCWRDKEKSGGTSRKGQSSNSE